MTTIATTTHISLGEHVRAETGRELQATLAELLDLQLVGKQLHWTVVGPLFRPLHLYLDELVDEWREMSDTVAERAVAIGFFPDGQADEIARASEAGKIEVGPIEDHAVIGELTRRVSTVAEQVRERMDRLGELDLASQDVLVEILRGLEQQLWMIRVQFASVKAG
jgi:starvation-inducible DNA-binding protein